MFNCISFLIYNLKANHNLYCACSAFVCHVRLTEKNANCNAIDIFSIHGPKEVQSILSWIPYLNKSCIIDYTILTKNKQFFQSSFIYTHNA